MFKLLFIISMLLPTVSANETVLVSLSDLNFTETNIVEIEQTDNLDFDRPALLSSALVQLSPDRNVKLSYFNPFIVQSYFQSFHSRAPPLIIFQSTFIA